MTPSEFDRWWDDYQRKFPSVLSWLHSLPEDYQREQFAVWRLVLGPVTLADALMVNRLMATGEVEAVGNFPSDREKTAQVVRSECEAMERMRKPRKQEDWETERYRCPDCRDTGYVEIFRAAWLRFLANLGGIPASFPDAHKAGWRGGRPTAMALCGCAAGDALIYRGQAEKAPPALPRFRVNTPDHFRYAPERCYRPAPGRDFSSDEWAAAVEWWFDRQDRRTGEVQYDEFEAWNAAPSDVPPKRQTTVEFKRP